MNKMFKYLLQMVRLVVSSVESNFLDSADGMALVLFCLKLSFEAFLMISSHVSPSL